MKCRSAFSYITECWILYIYIYVSCLICDSVVCQIFPAIYSGQFAFLFVRCILLLNLETLAGRYLPWQ